MEKLELRLTGVSPLVMHNSQLADPQVVRQLGLKALTAKRSKTEDDEDQIARLEWEGALYWDDKLKAYIPGLNMDAALAAAGSKLMKGGKKTVQSAIQCADAKLEYPNPAKTLDALYVPEHILRCVAVVPVSKSRVIRTRPIFKVWSATVVVSYHSLSRSQIKELAAYAGDVIGLGDWRPRHGRFTVEA